MDLDIHVTVHREKFIVINQLDALISQIYFRNETLHYSESSSVHHQKFFHCTHSNGICHTVLLAACEQAVSITCMTYTIAVCKVKNS